MSESIASVNNHITVTIYGKALNLFGDSDEMITNTLHNLLTDKDQKLDGLAGTTDAEGTYIASYSTTEPIRDAVTKTLESLNQHTTLNGLVEIETIDTWRADIFHEDEAHITYNLEDPQNFQSEEDWNWGVTLSPLQQ